MLVCSDNANNTIKSYSYKGEITAITLSYSTIAWMQALRY